LGHFEAEPVARLDLMPAFLEELQERAPHDPAPRQGDTDHPFTGAFARPVPGERCEILSKCSLRAHSIPPSKFISAACAAVINPGSSRRSSRIAATWSISRRKASCPCGDSIVRYSPPAASTH